MKLCRLLTIPTMAFAVCLLCVRFALGSDATDAWFGVPTTLTNVILILTFAGLIATQVYGLWNRKNHTSRDETIAGLKELNTTLRAKITDMDTAHKLLTDSCKAKLELSQVEKEALMGLSLQMRGILKELREQGLWKGDETRIFEHYVGTGHTTDAG